MFQTKIGKTKYDVQFRHVTTDLGERVTFCTITSKDGIEADGYSCMNGNFDRNKNRKAALARALQRRFPRSLRKPVWDSYFSVRNGKW